MGFRKKCRPVGPQFMNNVSRGLTATATKSNGPSGQDANCCVILYTNTKQSAHRNPVMNDAPNSNLSTARREFVDLWGQMAEHWGINRTMAQIHALLMISPAPITADQIMEDLQISRGAMFQ